MSALIKAISSACSFRERYWNSIGFINSLLFSDVLLNTWQYNVSLFICRCTSNSAPVAHAGTEQSGYVYDTITLDGSGSTDVDGNLLTYGWAFTTVLSGSSATLNDPEAVKPTFTIDKAGIYVASLVVNDGTLNSVADTVIINTLNSAPVADAGSSLSVVVGNAVTLDGCANAGAPDKNDWITNCASQGLVYQKVREAISAVSVLL